MDLVKIAVVPGDGIGPEVCDAAVAVLRQATAGVADLSFEHYEAGAECFRRHGTAFPETTQRACLDADAVLHGAVGLSDITYPDGTEVGQDFSMKVRALLDLYANIRPVRRYPGLAIRLASDRPIDYVIVRENTEGFYAARAGGNVVRDRVATDTLVMTRDGVERIVRHAAGLAMRRGGAPGDGKRRVTIVDKANVLRSYAFFRKVALEVLEDYPGIEVECMMIDAMAAHLIQTPERFDILVTENIFGDILSDLGAATVGGLGIAPSAEIGPKYGYFQGIHGSAPDITGKGTANPIATILSGAMMLEWLGERPGREALVKAGHRIRQAVETVVDAGDNLTRDIGGSATTRQATDAMLARLDTVPA